MGAFTAFFTDGAGWLVEKLKEFLVGADRPDLSVGWWVQRYQLMLALAMVVAGATLLLALVDAAAKASLEGPSSPMSRWPRSSGRLGRC